MKVERSLLLLLTFGIITKFSLAQEDAACLLSAGGIAVVIGLVAAVWQYKSTEHCDTDWINPNLRALEHQLRTKLHGQPLVIDLVMASLQNHVGKRKNPPKALVLSLHGWPGNGKNFVSSIIANNLYYKGMQSQFVHLYTALDFPHKEYVKYYKLWLTSQIKQYVHACEQSLFIFDELDHVPPGLLDTLSTFIDYHSTVDNIDFRKSIFLFLSNIGGNEINEIALDYWKKTGLTKEGIPFEERERIKERMTLEPYERELSKATMNFKGGLWNSKLISKSLINVFIPFLPMDREDVSKCVQDDLRTREKIPYGTSWVDVTNQVLNKLTWFPKDGPLFSTSGCKHINDKVNQVLRFRENVVKRNKQNN